MILDGLLQFTGTAGSVSANVDSPTTGTQTSTNVIDLLNARDIGIGDSPALEILVQVMTAFTGGTSLQVKLQGSVDNSSYTDMIFGPVITEANLLVGTHLLDVTVPRIAGAFADRPGASEALPRYLRLAYVTVGTHGAGALCGYIVLDRQDQISYPPGIVINN